jgi:hypothetical protein
MNSKTAYFLALLTCIGIGICWVVVMWWSEVFYGGFISTLFVFSAVYGAAYTIKAAWRGIRSLGKETENEDTEEVQDEDRRENVGRIDENYMQIDNITNTESK